MGHIVGKDLFKKLGNKIEGIGNHLKAPNNEKFQKILKFLYTKEEAELVYKMPFGFASLKKIEKQMNWDILKTQKIIDSCLKKGLIIDFSYKEKTVYAPSPFILGFYEFLMMRLPQEDTPKIAKLFHDYLEDGEIFHANYGHGETLGIGRALPYENALEDISAEVLDYERASKIIDQSSCIALSMCACRHEMDHIGNRPCSFELDTCLSLNNSAEYLIRNDFARKIDTSQALSLLETSQKAGLVLTADNIQKDISFICQCCGCCCHILQGINKHGLIHAISTSSYIASIKENCIGCKKCISRCQVHAIEMKDKKAFINKDLCIGCGACVSSCPVHAISFLSRPQKVIPPEDIFERVFLSNLERGTLQNFIFDNPLSQTHEFLRLFSKMFLKNKKVQRLLKNQKVRSFLLDRIRD